MKADYLVVGSGLTGATVARRLADAGRDVLVVERRNRIGGNVADDVHEPSGIRFNLHGPHYFRTNSDKLWDWVQRFSEFRPYEARVLTLVDGRLEKWPIQRDAWGFLKWHETSIKAHNFEEACLQRIPSSLYEKLVKPYTELQWGVPAHTLSADLASRIPIRDGDDRLSTHKHQGLPVDGYSRWVENMLKGVPVLLNYNAMCNRVDYERMVWTGPIDEFYNYQHGRLRYRTQRREHHCIGLGQQGVFFQDVAQVNNPAGPSIRTIEWKHLSPRRHDGTLITREYPQDSTDPDTHEYPFPSEEEQARYRLYAEDAKQLPNVTFCGRLGLYVYYDMDQAIAAAHKVADRLLEERP